MVAEGSLSLVSDVAMQATPQTPITSKPPDRPSQPGAGDHAERQAAMLAFWQTGDATGLTPLAAAEAPAFPVDEFVALAQLLTPAQCAQLLAHRGGRRGHDGGPGLGPERGSPMGGEGGHCGLGMGAPELPGGRPGPMN